MIADLKFAARVLLKAPAFSLVAVLTLALGIGANTAIFSVIEGTLLRPLPFPNPERLVRLYEAEEDGGARGASLNLSDRTVQQWRQFGRDIFEEIAAGTGGTITVGLNDGAPLQIVPAVHVTANFFSVLGLPPSQGRAFTADDDHGGAAHVAIISDDFWRHILNRRRDVLGCKLMLDGQPCTVIGVMPKSFRHPYRAEIWLPLALPSLGAATAVNHYLYGVGRLRPGLSFAQAEEAVRRLCASINRADPDPANPRAAYLPPLRESFVMDLRPKLLVIVAAAVCALMIAAANFAGLLLSRVIEREGEFALRAALGASRGQLIRQQLIQGAVLAGLGTAIGLVVAAWATPILMAMSPEGSDFTGSAMREFDSGVRMDLPVFAFAAGVMCLIGLGFGFIPAARASRPNLRGSITALGRSVTLDRKARRLLGSFVVVELAIAAALLTASVTAAQFFRKLVDQPWGFETRGRIAFSVTVPDRYFGTAAAKQAALDGTLVQLRAVPGVSSATLTAPSPMNASWNLMTFNAEGSSAPEPRGYYVSYSRASAPGYFNSIGQPLLRGREFLATDGPDAPLVCIVSNSIARRFWPGRDPIGKRIKWGRLDGTRPWFTIVGVVADMKALADPRDGEVIGMIAKPISQVLAHASAPLDDITFVIHRTGNGLTEASIRAALARADARLASYNIISLEDAAAQSRTTERFIFVLVSSFGVLGLVLAAVGLYGLLSLQVARREREFGIRTALGATAIQLIRLVANQGASLLGLGLAAGTATTWAVFRLVQNQWGGMPLPNMIAWLAGAGLLVAAAALACWIPARRASRVDPIIALRQE